LIKTITVSIFILLCLPFCAQEAVAKDYPYKIVGNEIILFGKKIKTTIPLKVSKPKSELDTVVAFEASPNNNYVVVDVNTVDQDEYFLYSKKTDLIKQLKFDYEPNSIVSWIDNSKFSISWGGMDFSFTRIFDANNPNNSVLLENVLKILDSKYYVSYIPNGVKIGCIFSCKMNSETFSILDANGKPLDSWTRIDAVTQNDHSISIAISGSNGKSIQRVIHPKILEQ